MWTTYTTLTDRRPRERTVHCGHVVVFFPPSKRVLERVDEWAGECMIDDGCVKIPKIQKRFPSLFPTSTHIHFFSVNTCQQSRSTLELMRTLFSDSFLMHTPRRSMQEWAWFLFRSSHQPISIIFCPMCRLPWDYLSLWITSPSHRLWYNTTPVFFTLS